MLGSFLLRGSECIYLSFLIVCICKISFFRISIFHHRIPLFSPFERIAPRGKYQYGTVVSLFLAVFSQKSDVFFRVRDGLRPFSHRNWYPRGEYLGRSLYWDRIRVHVRGLLTLMPLYGHRGREMRKGSGRFSRLDHFVHVSQMVSYGWRWSLHLEMLLWWRHHSQTRGLSLRWISRRVGMFLMCFQNYYNLPYFHRVYRAVRM